MPQVPDSNLDIKLITEELYKRNAELYVERKRTEELLYKVSEAIYATDENNKITLFNHTLEKLLDVKAEDVIGKDISEILTLTDPKGNLLDLYKINSYIKVATSEIPIGVLKSHLKEHYLHIKASEIVSSDGKKEYLVTMSDVTTEKELEKEKEEFISITSHELKTPLSIIKSYLWMLEANKGGELTEKQKGYVQKAMNGTERLIGLVNDMLNISRTEQERMEFKKDKFDIVALLFEVGAELELKANEKNLKLNLEIVKEKTIMVLGDRQKTREILINIVGNAVKYTDIGSISIKIEEEPNMIKISTRDTGKGIDPDDIGKLFQKFNRLNSTMSSVSGTGLGLYIVKLYVERMGGKVGVTSEGIDKGSTFWFSLKKGS